MKAFYLIRHAQSESNAGHNIAPNQDIILTKLGRQQATELADWLVSHVPSADQVFVSSYVRTHETAQPYLDKSGHQPHILPDLREFNYLDYEHIKDLSFAQLVSLADEFWAKADKHYQDSPTTDSFANLVARVWAVRQTLNALPDGTYIIFTHGMWLGMLMWQLLHGYHGDDCPRLFNVSRFREFEVSVRPKNCEVFLMNSDDTVSTITKVRSRGDD